MKTMPAIEGIMVTIYHPYGDLTVPLEEWITTGPGPRTGLRPCNPYYQVTGEPLPPDVIPLVYRNTRWSRLLIALRLLPRPWPPWTWPSTEEVAELEKDEDI